MRKHASHFLSLSNHVNESLFKLEFSKLEIVRKSLLDGTFDNTSSGESYKYLRFCNDDISEGGK